MYTRDRVPVVRNRKDRFAGTVVRKDRTNRPGGEPATRVAIEDSAGFRYVRPGLVGTYIWPSFRRNISDLRTPGTPYLMPAGRHREVTR